jgi:hypothetical protein
MYAGFLFWLITALTSTSILVIFKRKEFDKFSLFRCLFLMPTITKNSTSHIFEDKNSSSVFIASAERIGIVSYFHQLLLYHF